MKRPAVLNTKGTAILRSFLYRPGATKDQTCQRIQGDDMNSAASSGSLK